LWIVGETIDGSSAIDVVNPATEQAFPTIARSNEALVTGR